MDPVSTIVGGDTVFQGFVIYLFNPLYKLAAVSAFAYFLFGVAKYIYDLNNPEKKTTGKAHMFWGLVGLFIIFSIGGFIPMMAKWFNFSGF